MGLYRQPRLRESDKQGRLKAFYTAIQSKKAGLPQLMAHSDGQIESDNPGVDWDSSVSFSVRN
jgi:hypothetical protein